MKKLEWIAQPAPPVPDPIHGCVSWKMSIPANRDDIEPMEVHVHRHKDFNPDAWLLTCEPLGITHILDNIDIDQAKVEALTTVLWDIGIILWSCC